MKIVELAFQLYHSVPSVKVTWSNGSEEFLPLTKVYANTLRKVNLATHGVFEVE